MHVRAAAGYSFAFASLVSCVACHAIYTAMCSPPALGPAIRIVTTEMGPLFCMGGGAEPTATAAAALKDFEHVLGARARQAAYSKQAVQL